MNAKRILSLFLTCFFIICFIHAQDDSKGTVSSISFLDPSIDKNVSVNQDVIKQFVRAQMEYFVTNYSTIGIDSSNEKQLLEYQKQNDKTASGRINFTIYSTNTKITKLDDSNMLSLEIDDTTKGTSMASAAQPVTDAQLNSNEQLTNVIGTLMSDILQQLDVKLTPYQIDCMKGVSKISDATSANLQQIIDFSKTEIALLDAKLTNLKNSNDDANANELAKLQARHDKLVLKTKDNERRLAQKIADEKITEDEKVADATQKDDEDYQKELDKQKKNLEAQKKKLETEERRAEAKEKTLIFLSPAKHGGIEGGVKYANIGNSDQSSAYFVAIDIPISKVFIGAEVSGWNIAYIPSSSNTATDNYGNKTTSTTASSFDFADATWDIGGRLGMHFTWFKMAFSPYFAIGGGYEFNGSFSPLMYYLQGTAGCHLLYLFDVAYNCRYTEDGSFNHSLGLSIAINGPWFSKK